MRRKQQATSSVPVSRVPVMSIEALATRLAAAFVTSLRVSIALVPAATLAQTSGETPTHVLASVPADTITTASAIAADRSPAAAAPTGPIPAGIVKLPATGRQIVLADLEGRGRAEPVIVFGDADGCRLARLIAKSGAPALDELSLPGDPRLRSPLVADGDGDGTVDVLSADPDGVLVWKGLGGGRFAASRRILVADDLLLPLEGCAAAPSFVHDTDGDGTAELVLPVLGGVRIVRPGPTPAVSPAGVDLLTEPRADGGNNGVSFLSPLPSFVGREEPRTLVLGPLLDPRNPRLDFGWWTVDRAGSLAGHRTSLALPPGETAVVAYVFDLEGDGRPDIALLTAPRRVRKLLDEFGLRVYRASDTADRPVQPFFSAATNINYWQNPTLAARPVPGGSDLLIAFYRGLTTAHLNVEIFSSNGQGSFVTKPRDLELDSDKKARRGFLRWTDVDGDGTIDLLAAGESGILTVHRGAAERERPVGVAPAWTGAVVAGTEGVTMSLGDSGAMTISHAAGGSFILCDIDGDGTPEEVHLKNDHGGTSVAVERLRAPAR